MKNGRDLVSEAVTDAKALKEAAMNAAKNEILEALAPSLKSLLEKNINEALSKNEDSDRMRRGVEDNWPGESHTGFEEAKEKGESKMDKRDDKDLDLESLANFFPSVSETSEEEGEKVEEGEGIPTLGEGEGCEGEEGEEEVKEAKEEDMDEEIEISEAELQKAFESALQLEVQVKKGFSDMTKAGELDAVVKDAGKGLNPEKKGEHEWDGEEPPHKQDFTVKEMIQRGLAENKALRAENKSLSETARKLTSMVKALAQKLSESNLFNAKVMHVNKVLSGNKLTNEQKRVVLESFDKAKTISEVKTVYSVITSSFATGNLVESRKPKANSQRARTSGGADQKVLRESVDRAADGGMSERLKRLAGITK